MPLNRDRAICLRKVEFSETSQILTLFCRRSGSIRVIAKGAHRRTKEGASKFDGGADLLDVGDCVFIDHSSRDLGTLTEWKLIDGHIPLRTNLRAMLLAQYLAEILSLLLGENDPHTPLFDRLRVTLPALTTPRVEEEFLAMQLDVLNDTGYLPSFTSCVNCGGKIDARAAYMPQRPGLICQNCEPAYTDRIAINPRLLGIAGSILKLPRVRAVPQRLPRLTRAQTDPLNAFLANQIQQIIQRRLNTARYIC
ncbi:MAG: DNA repair protein RecO [Burkholderiales bacterium]|nr:DNA repair protein RecO [Phycisphaerae bacterium]